MDTLEKANWIDEVLTFWFEELTEEDWWSGSADVDDRIRSRFADLQERLSTGIPKLALEDAKAALAAVIVYDQFPRNIFRKTARAFATDATAITVARNALDRAFDTELTTSQRTFLYLPFEHSEVLADQERSVALFRNLGVEGQIGYAVEHRDIIAKFGRFPHRNRSLERESTPAELAFLQSHEGFGQ